MTGALSRSTTTQGTNRTCNRLIQSNESNNHNQRSIYFRAQHNTSNNQQQSNNRFIENNSEDQGASTTNLTSAQRITALGKTIKEIKKIARINYQPSPNTFQDTSSTKTTILSDTAILNSTESKRRKLDVTQQAPVGVNSTNQIIPENQYPKSASENNDVSYTLSIMSPDLEILTNEEKPNTVLISKNDVPLGNAIPKDILTDTSKLIGVPTVIDEPHDIYKTCLIKKDNGSVVEAEYEILSESASELEISSEIENSINPIFLNDEALAGVTENSGVYNIVSESESELDKTIIIDEPLSESESELDKTIIIDEPLSENESELDKTIIIDEPLSENESELDKTLVIDEPLNIEDNGKSSLFSKEDMDIILKDYDSEIARPYLHSVNLSINTRYLIQEISLAAINKIRTYFTSKVNENIMFLMSQLVLLNKKLLKLSLIHNNQTNSLCYKKYCESLVKFNDRCERMENHEIPGIISSFVEEIAHIINSFTSPRTSEVTTDNEQSESQSLLNDSNGHNVINENNQEETHISSISKVTRDEEQSESQFLLNDSNGHNVINENNQEETHISSISKV
ncbi:MAG: hypothetical protein QG673_1015, partial [Pseudomonadota bacterium]|nr:hypothetical protein [Pseudomonadota bacterium]